eukprot:COSAG02_NODE_7233_length_3106_cov_1.757566_1_plen_830_part_00
MIVRNRRPAVVAAYALLLLPCAAAMTAIVPTPQLYARAEPHEVVDLRGWAVAASASVGQLSVARLVNATASRRVASLQRLPHRRAIALGVVGDEDQTHALAGVSVHSSATTEGYVLLVQPDLVLILGNSAAGVFYGVQSLLQLLAGGTVAPACRVDDWPDFPMRGSLMSEMTEMNNLNKVDVPCWDRTPPHTSGGFCAHLNYTLQLVDWMVEHKMNIGIPDVPWLGTDAYYNVAPGVNPNVTQAKWIETRLQELQLYMQERHVQFVPIIHSPDGNSLFDPRMVEGKWVQNSSFIFDKTTDVARAKITKPTMASQLNGDFERLGIDGRPLGWTFTGVSPILKQWTVDSTSAPWTSKSGRSLRCEMTSVPCSLKNAVRWANNRAVPRVQHEGPCLGEVATSPLLSVTGGSIVQITMWARMTNFSAPQGQAPQITAMTYNKFGGYALDAFYSGAGSILYTWDLDPSWQEFSTAITLPKNATHLALESSFRCYGCRASLNLSATWQIADLSVTELDVSLRNVLRTNVTDFEVMGSGRDADVRYIEGTDYTVEEPHTPLNSRELNLTVLQPFVLRRIATGRIARGAEVRVSYDYLPGIVDSQQHIPMAYGEPLYYSFMDNVVASLVRAFPNVTMLHLNHDEIRGMARDSRSLRLGLSNTELLARDINALERIVTKYMGQEARIILWDDMVNPDHNGNQTNYQWWEGGGRPQTTDGALLKGLVDSRVLWFSWAYCTSIEDYTTASHAPQLYQTHGYDWLAGPYTPTASVLMWAKAMRAAKLLGEHALGILDVQFAYPPAADVKQFGNIPAVAAAGWNVAAFISDPRPIRNVSGCG